MDKANKLTWKQQYKELITRMNNNQLFEEYKDLLTSVDEDAIMPVNDTWMLQKVEVELKERLVNCGFLPPF